MSTYTKIKTPPKNCRICDADKSENIDLYYIDEQKSSQLKVVYPKFVIIDLINIINDDPVSKIKVSNYICSLCAKDLAISYNFQLRVKASEERLWKEIKINLEDHELLQELVFKTYPDAERKKMEDEESKSSFEHASPMEPEIILEPFFISEFESTSSETNKNSRDHISDEIESPLITGVIIDTNDLESKSKIPLCDIKVNQINGEDGKAIFVCIYCEKKFTRKDNAQRHVKEQHILKNNYSASYISDKVSKNNLIEKTVTNQIQTALGADQRHFFVCTICEKSFSQKGNARRHHREIHGKDTSNLTISDCNSGPFSSLCFSNDDINLNIPVACILEEANGENRHEPSSTTSSIINEKSCNFELNASKKCGIIYDNDLINKRTNKEIRKDVKFDNLDKVMNNDEEIVISKLCKTSFTQESKALRHLKVQHYLKNKDEKYINTFSSLTEKIHTKYTCEHCSNYFHDEQLFLCHVASCIDNEKSLVSVAKIKRNSQQDLEENILKHSNEKYACKLCYTTFTKKCNGIRHLKNKHFNKKMKNETKITSDDLTIIDMDNTYQLPSQHNHSDDDLRDNEYKIDDEDIQAKIIIININDRQCFVCTQCQNEFENKASIIQHIVQYHSQNPSQLYRCMYCVYRTNKSENLVDHVEHVHNNKAPNKSL